MKLGLLIPEFPTQTHSFFWREVEALRGLGAEVVVLSTRRPRDGCPHPQLRAALSETHYVFPPSPRAALRAFRRSPAQLAEVVAYVCSLSPGARARASVYAICAADLVDYARREGITHIHVHSCAEAAHVAAISRILGGPSYSLHLHGDLPVYGTDHPQKMQRASFVAAAASSMQQQVIEGAGVPAARTCCMTMGVDLGRFQPRPARPARGPLHVVSISRLAACKGHHYGLEALRRAIDAGADLRYSIAGSGPDRGNIEADVRRLRLSERVRFVGSLSEAGVTELLAMADVFLLTSVGQGEASPVAVMEAMAMGVPAICSVIGGTPDMISHEQDGILVEQADVAAIQRALGRLHADRAGLRRLGDAARARAEREFDARQLAQRLLDTLREQQLSAAHAPL